MWHCLFTLLVILTTVAPAIGSELDGYNPEWPDTAGNQMTVIENEKNRVTIADDTTDRVKRTAIVELGVESLIGKGVSIHTCIN